MRTNITTHPETLFNSETNEVLGFAKNKYPAGTHLSEKSICITNIDEINIKCECVDGAIVNGRLESLLFLFGLSVSPGLKDW